MKNWVGKVSETVRNKVNPVEKHATETPAAPAAPQSPVFDRANSRTIKANTALIVEKGHMDGGTFQEMVLERRNQESQKTHTV